MKTIWKYILEEEDINSIMMPKGANPISAQVQHNKICLWAIVETKNDLEDRLFFLATTGNPMIDNGLTMNFIDTIQLYGGDVVCHLFEMKE